jgi:hypothetical protein
MSVSPLESKNRLSRERDVAAGVFIGEKFALEAADEAFLRAVIAREGKRDGFPFLDFLRCCNPNARHGGRVMGSDEGRKPDRQGRAKRVPAMA